jgi:hypothetical protein
MWGSIISGLLGAAGSYQAQKKLGQAGDKMFSAGDQAWERGQYKPYGVTTGAGSATFEDGQAKFDLDPRYQQQQDQMFGLGSSALQAAGGDYDQLAGQMYDRQRALGAGSRAGEAQALGESMFGSGTQGLRVSGEALGAGAGTDKFSPQGYGFAQAFAQQDAADRANAFGQAQMQRERDIGIGSSMFGQGQAIDQLGLGMLGLGGDLGSQQASADSNAMQNLINAYGQGAGFMGRRGQSMAGGFQGLGSSLGGFSGGGSGAFSNPAARLGNYSSFGGNSYNPTTFGSKFSKYGTAASFANPEYADVGGYY